jgi:MFS family permease
MVGGLLVSSILSGRVITATGLWKRWLVGGMVAVIAGIGLLSTIDAATPLWHTGIFMAVLGLGLGATMQNLVLAVQNTIALADMGAGSSVVAFFRSLGGSVGIAALGAVLAHQVADAVEKGLRVLLSVHPEYADAVGHDTGGIPDVSGMPAPIRAIFESAFGDATGHIFLVALPFAVGALIAVLLIQEVPLRTSVKRDDELMAEAAVDA